MRRWNVVLLVSLACCLTSLARAETVYFLVAEKFVPPSHNDSYVLPLSRPNDITHARELIEYGPEIGQSIAVAAIDHWDPNNGVNMNRDYRCPGMPAWSWYVTEFVEFTDLIMEVLDGWPGAVELDVQAWMDNTGGLIGFGAYTVVAELGTDPEPWNCDLDLTGVVDFNDLAQITSHWLDSPCCHRYWCDGADLDGSGQVGMYDFAILARNWLWEK